MSGPVTKDRKRRGTCVLAGVAVVYAMAGCDTGLPPEDPASLRQPATAAPAPVLEDSLFGPSHIDVPKDIPGAKRELHRVASKIDNPRGMLATKQGLLVASAGTGDANNPATGALLRLHDDNGDGDFDDNGERTTVLDKQQSANIVDIVRRDEVFGMAAVEEGGGTVLATLAFFGGPSTVFKINGDSAIDTGKVQGNLNDLAYDPERRTWFAVSSSSDEIIRFTPGARGERVLKLPALSGGQDAVPGYLTRDPLTEELLVSLFSGSVKGESGGQGIELVPRAGSIVRVDPESKAVHPIVTGLTAPTDILALDDGTLFVLEFCDAFLEPLTSREQLRGGPPRHGGFKRFSGRLLEIDRKKGEVTTIAAGLDGPTNLAVDGKRLYIAQGMGTPGRLIPGPNGPVALQGFIDALTLDKVR